MDTYQRVRFLLRYVDGDQVNAEDLIDWACEEMVAGADTPHLRRLAGYLRSDIVWQRTEIERDFLLAMRELGVDRKVPEEFKWREYLCFFMGLYEDGYLSVREAAGRIGWIEWESEWAYSVYRDGDSCTDIYLEFYSMSDHLFLAKQYGMSLKVPVFDPSGETRFVELLDSESIDAYLERRLHQVIADCCGADTAAKTA